MARTAKSMAALKEQWKRQMPRAAEDLAAFRQFAKRVNDGIDAAAKRRRLAEARK